MKCKDIRWMFALYDSGELSPEEQEMAETHLASCEKCRQELTRLSKVPDLIQSLHGDTWWADVSSTVREQINTYGEKGVPSKVRPIKTEKKGITMGLPKWRPVHIGSIAAAIMERPVWLRAIVVSTLVLIALTSTLLIRPWEGNNISQLALDLAQNNSQVQTMLGERVPETQVELIDGIANVGFSTNEVLVTAVVNVEDMRVMAIHIQALIFLPPGPPIFHPELTENEKEQAITIAENDSIAQVFLSHGFTLGEPISSYHILGADTRHIAWLPLVEGTVIDDYRGIIVNLDNVEDVTVIWGGEIPSWWPFA